MGSWASAQAKNGTATDTRVVPTLLPLMRPMVADINAMPVVADDTITDE